MELPGRKREMEKGAAAPFLFFAARRNIPLEKIRRMARSDEPKADENPIF